MLKNTPESYLYSKLPDGLISLDERGLISCICGGFQSRLDDLRSYAGKLSYFWSVDSLPDGTYNVVSAEITSAQGLVYKRSLDITDDTPDISNIAALRTWAAKQLKIDERSLGAVMYDRDLLRLVDTSVLEYLAETIGAVLHQSSLLATSSEQRAAHERLVSSYFSRLKIKGTPASFELLGAALGFSDIRVTPLWSRLSARQPQDVGNAANDTDYSAEPDFYPQQEISASYDPFEIRDGPFYAWSGTCSNGTSSTSYYPSVVNGFNPWVELVVVGTGAGSIANGTAAHISAGVYPLAGGAFNVKAQVEPAGSSFRLRALTEGAAFNGLCVCVGTVGVSGTDRLLSIYDQLSAVKYRSSYFDLGLSVDLDSAVDTLGVQPASKNSAVASGSYIADGVLSAAVSPYRAWSGGSVASSTVTADYVTRILPDNGTSVIAARTQLSGTNSELILDRLLSAGAQAVDSFEEVRPATRFVRRSSVGFSQDDPATYAAYVSFGTLFVASGTATSYAGSHAQTPLGDYTAQLSVALSSGSTVSLIAAINPNSTQAWSYYGSATGFLANGTYNFLNGSYALNFPSGLVATSKVLVTWTATSTEVVRPNPAIADISSDRIAYQARAEDGTDDTVLDQHSDSYPWLNQIVAGGELVESDSYIPEGLAATYVSQDTVFQDQTGADLDVVGITDSLGGIRLKVQTRATDSGYVPGLLAIAYNGTFNSLSAISDANNAVIRQPSSVTMSGTEGLHGTNVPTDYDVLFQPGYKLYHAGLVNNVLVADPVKFFGTHHRQGIVGWMPFNEHPEEALAVSDKVRVSEIVLSGISAGNRVWDAERGWHLSIPVNGTVAIDASRGLVDEWSISLWLKPDSGCNAAPVLVYEPMRLVLDENGSKLKLYARDSSQNLQLVASAYVPYAVFSYVCVIKRGNQYSFGVGNSLNAATWQTASIANAADADPAYPSTLLITAPSGSTVAPAMGLVPHVDGIHSVRIRVSGTYTVFLDNWVDYPVPTLWLPHDDGSHALMMTATGTVGSFGLYVNPAWQVRTTSAFYIPHVDGSRAAPLTVAGIPPALAPHVGALVIPSYASNVGNGLGVHDVRIWSETKTTGQAELVRYHAPVETKALYALGSIRTANRGDSWGMKVLTSGWIAPAALSPGYQRKPQYMLVNRYDSAGVCSGNSAYKMTGMGGGISLPGTLALGYVLSGIDSSGTVVTSGSWGALPGVNSVWHTDTSTLYPLDQFNPVRDRIWIAGTAGDGALYEVTLFGTRVGANMLTFLSGTAVYRGTITYDGTDYPGIEQNTGANVVIAGSGYRAFYSSSAGTVVQLPDAGTSTPPQWLYLNQRVVDSFPGESRWTRSGYTAAQQGVDITGNYGIVADYGVDSSALLLPVIGDNGRLEFENTSALVPGRYRLTLDTGNIGLPDLDFDGFNVEINADETIVQTTLVRNNRTFNARATDVVYLDINSTVTVGTWLLSLRWYNALRDTARGTMRQLAVYGYKLERLATEMFRVEISPGGAHCNVVPVAYSQNNPGEWITQINSYGTRAAVAHGGTVYPANDTYTSRVPLSDMLTATTNDRTEDVYVSSITAAPGTPTFLADGTRAYDSAAIVMPTFGTLTNS